MRVISVALLIIATPVSAPAHHSVAGFYDPSEKIEIEGVITAISWRNPHVMIEIDVPDPSGEITNWQVESGDVGVLRSRGLNREFLQVGDTVTIYGDISLRGRPETFARNLLTSDGQEVLLTIGSRRYFSTRGDGELATLSFDEEIEEAARRSAEGIFRVWSVNFDEQPASEWVLFDGNYPLTSEAEAAKLEWNPSDSGLIGCTESSMPLVMSSPLPIEFVREGADIVVRLEQNDVERYIHMGAEPADAPNTNSAYGYSRGSWERDSLIVETTNLLAARLDGEGTPHSSSIHLLERFTPAPDGSRLDYRVTITDTVTFTEPLNAGRYWIWRPEIPLGSYACGEEQPRQ